MNTTYQYARLYVNHCGLSVVPQWYRQKTLMIKGSAFQQRPPSPDHLARWFPDTRPRNIAIVPGAVSDNLCVLDFDNRHTWATFHALTGWDGPIVSSGRGIHVYIRLQRLPERNCQGFFEGLHFGDIIVRRSVTAPPSVHPSGRAYRWHGNPQRIPYLRTLDDIGIEGRAWLTDEQRDAQQRPLPQATRTRSRAGIANPQAYAAAALRQECAKIQNTIEGRRNHQLYVSALKMGKFADVLPPEQIADALGNAASVAGLNRAEIRGTIRSGLTRGMR